MGAMDSPPKVPVHAAGTEDGAAGSRRSYQPVESLMRGLELLKLVNMLRLASVNDLHKLTGIAKPTVVRMLETLMAAGYVTRDKTFGGYRVTADVQNLSDGYFGAPMVIEAAHSHALELTQKIKWGVGVGMLEGYCMRLQFTTARYSPWAMPMTSLRMRLPLFTSSMGRTYLSFCPDQERDSLIEMELRRLNPPDKDDREKSIRHIIEVARDRGYARKAPERKLPNIDTISVPIRYDDIVLGTIGMGYFTTAVSDSELDEKLFLPLRATADAIERKIADDYGASGAGRHGTAESAHGASGPRGDPDT